MDLLSDETIRFTHLPAQFRTSIVANTVPTGLPTSRPLTSLVQINLLAIHRRWRIIRPKEATRHRPHTYVKDKSEGGDPNSPETLPDRIDIAGVGYLARIPGQGIENQGDYWLHDVHGNTVHYPIVSLPQTITALPRQNALRRKDRLAKLYDLLKHDDTST